MSTRDSRSDDFPEPPTQPGDAGRESTQSLDLDADEVQSVSLALGTGDPKATSLESPNARGKPPATQPAKLPPAPTAGGRAPTPDPYLGAVLGSYRVLELLGKGGMGHVYRAEHVKLGREVALKLLRSDYASRRDAVARFFQEARTVNRIRHRNIVEVTDFVELEDGTTYIIMELLTGTSLGAWARRGVDLQRTLAVLIQICDGLAAAHQVAIVHRDLKPDNVILVPTAEGERVKLLDFGVAKLLDREDEDYEINTAAGAVIGTPSYMSPEQAGGMVVDARSDIYSLGAIMYELFCGQPVFRGRSFGDYVRLHLTEVPVPPRRTPGGAQIDRQLEAVILRCLEKDPEQRFSNIGALRDALIALHGPLSASTSGISASTSAGSMTAGVPSPLPSAIPPPAVSRTTPWRVWLGAAAAAVAIGVVAAIAYSSSPRAADSPGTHAVGAPAAHAAPPPAPQPSPPPAPAPRVELRFDAEPSGSVYAAGQPTELCHTPCVLQIERTDGDAGDHRTFVVRRDGYRDAAIPVDLTSVLRDFRVELQATAPAAKPPAPPRPARRPSRRLIKPAQPERTEPQTPVAPPAPEPAPAKPSPSTIDPADTLDPFRKK
ncbi:MAG TPA: serine/threonine-protein kinase [Kofleriaceae bacterium]|nr:serine/threonine-protein kinase [Kofleriaceae bacterium]